MSNIHGRRNSRRPNNGIIAAITLVVMTIVGAVMVSFAGAWPPPNVTGDCDSWSVQEVAPDNDWADTEYWKVDGVDGQHARGASVDVPDVSDTESRSFTIRWYSESGNQLDARSQEGVRDLSDCGDNPEPTVNGVAIVLDRDCEGVVVSGVINVDGPHPFDYVIISGGIPDVPEGVASLPLSGDGLAAAVAASQGGGATWEIGTGDINGPVTFLYTDPSDEECEPPLTPVTPAAPSKTDVCGTSNDTYSIPATVGVVYKVNGEVVAAGPHAGNGSVVITAHAVDGYVLAEGATSSWTLVFTNEACPVTPPPTVPPVVPPVIDPLPETA